MAKQGPENWKIPSENEINTQYGTKDDIMANATQKSATSYQIEQQRKQMYQLASIAIALIIVIVAVSLIIYVVNARKSFNSVHNTLDNSRHSREMEQDSLENDEMAQDNNNMSQDMNSQPQGAYPQEAVPMQNSYPQENQVNPQEQTYPGGNQPAPQAYPEQQPQQYPQGSEGQGTYPQTY